MDAKNMEPWREIEPFLGCDVPKQEVVLLSQVKAMCVAIAGDNAADLARLTAELERKQRECEGLRDYERLVQIAFTMFDAGFTTGDREKWMEQFKLVIGVSHA